MFENAQASASASSLREGTIRSTRDHFGASPNQVATFVTNALTTRRQVVWGQILALLGYATLCILCLGLVAYLRFRRRGALQGDEHAAARMILPAYEPLLWILAGVTGSFTFFFIVALQIGLYTTSFPKTDAEFMYAGRQFVFLLVILFLLQRSVSWPAIARSVALALVLATYTVPILWLLATFQNDNRVLMFVVPGVLRLLLLLVFAHVYIWPPTRASKRTIRQYCAFVFIYKALSLIGQILDIADQATASAVFSYLTLFWSCWCPLLVWRVLRADTDFWRGVGHRVCVGGDMNTTGGYGPTIRHQVIDDQVSSVGIHMLIEMHRKYVIDFAHLKLKKRIGIGSSSIVFSGELGGCVPVAIKVYTPRKFTELTIAEFSHEAAFCSTLRHPNIVKFVGICVYPPTVCLVAEYCRGNLDDILSVRTRKSSNQTDHHVERAITLAYMLDATRAVAYLHSFSPPLLHRDIKPANFLVDDDQNVKLTDFGESRRLPRSPMDTGTGMNREKVPESFTEGAPTGDIMSGSAPIAMMTVTGTVHYMAPEVISGRSGLAAYGQAADVYSLAITLWDILHPQHSKYPDIDDDSNHFLVLERVLAGGRPTLDSSLHPKMRRLITSAWHPDPNCRPLAQQIAETLEDMQEEALAVVAMDLCDDLERSAIDIHDDQSSFTVNSSTTVGAGANRASTPRHASFTGEYAIQRMDEVLGVDEQSGEGIRLGNALMDAGFLHHSTHSLGFECSSTATYFFDSDTIQFCHPVTILEERSAIDLSDEIWQDSRSLSEDTAPHSDPQSQSDTSRWSNGVLPGKDVDSGRRSTSSSSLLSSFTRNLIFNRTNKSANRRATKTTGYIPPSMTSNTAGGDRQCWCRRYGQRLVSDTDPVWGPFAPLCRRPLPWRARGRQRHRKGSRNNRLGSGSKSPNAVIDVLDDTQQLHLHLLDPELEHFPSVDAFDVRWANPAA